MGRKGVRRAQGEEPEDTEGTKEAPRGRGVRDDGDGRDGRRLCPKALLQASKPERAEGRRTYNHRRRLRRVYPILLIMLLLFYVLITVLFITLCSCKSFLVGSLPGPTNPANEPNQPQAPTIPKRPTTASKRERTTTNCTNDVQGSPCAHAPGKGHEKMPTVQSHKGRWKGNPLVHTPYASS